MAADFLTMAAAGVDLNFDETAGVSPHKSAFTNSLPDTLCATATMDPTPSTFNPQPETRNPKPSTLNPQPETLNPKHRTLGVCGEGVPVLRVLGLRSLTPV